MEILFWVAELGVWLTIIVFIGLMIYPNKHNTCDPTYPECFDCKKSDCGGCEVNKEKEVI
jgi:hypothetical protein